MTCDNFFEAYPATPSLPVCTHSGLFIEEGNYETCFNLPLDEKCFRKIYLCKAYKVRHNLSMYSYSYAIYILVVYCRCDGSVRLSIY